MGFLLSSQQQTLHRGDLGFDLAFELPGIEVEHGLD